MTLGSRAARWVRAVLVFAAGSAAGFFDGVARADVSEQVPLGARAIGMGGAFSSIADDATALFWNPAGIVRIGHQEITGGTANLFDIGIRDNFAAFVLPLHPNHAVALDWYHSGYEDPNREGLNGTILEDSPLEFGENRFDVTYGMNLGSRLSLGMTAKYLSRDVTADGSTVDQGSGHGWGMDFGALATPWRGLRVGLVAQDAFDTKIEDSQGGSSVAFPRNIRAAASYAVRKDALLAVDVDDRWHLGAEYAPIELLAVRGGVQKDRDGDEDATWSLGAGLKWEFFRFDFAREWHPVLEATNHLQLTMAFNFNPAQIRIEKVEARNLYASLYKSYAREPVGTIRVKNLQDVPLTAKLRVEIPGLTDAPSEQEIVLRPKATQEVPMTAVLSERMMSQSGDRPVEVKVSAAYQSLRLSRTEKGSARCVAYAPGAISWGQGVEAAAAFVTTRDPVVEAVAREATHAVSKLGERPFGNRNLDFAAAMVDAVATLGVSYVPDPTNPYSAISETANAVDTIFYPRQTLEKRAGDCDDMSVLLAALLGNVGVPTQLVDVPGHIFLMVGTGVHERNRLALGLEEGLYVVDRDELWIPLEATALGKGFAEAWRVGAESHASWSSRGRLRLVDVAAAQARFEPADFPDTGTPPRLPDPTALGSRLTEDAAAVSGWRSEYMKEHYGAARPGAGVTEAANNELAHVYFLAGSMAEARGHLEEILAGDPRSARGHNNLAAVDLVEGRPAEAFEHFRLALDIDPSDAGVWLNLGVARYASGDTLAADEPLIEGLKRSGGYEEACRLLGIPIHESAARGASKKMTYEEARALLKEALRKVPTIGGQRPAEPPAGKDAKPPDQTKPAPETRVAAARAGEKLEIQNVLYWKD